MPLMEILISAIVLGLVPAFIATSKGKNFMLWWLYGAMIFIAALPHALLTKADAKTLEVEALADGGRKCPHCAEVVKSEAKVCRFCQRDLPDPDGPDDKSLMLLHGISREKNLYVVTYYQDYLKENRTEQFSTLSDAVEYSKTKIPAKYAAAAATLGR